MSQQEILLKIFEFVILVFSLSLHEAAHAWMASRLGDQTARMMGRVTLNPVKHIDPIGTVLLPLAMLFLGSYGRFLIGWAKPTPVTTRNFKNIRRDDTLVTLAGPCSNLLAALLALIALVILTKASPAGMMAVHSVIVGAIDPEMMASAVFPMAIIFYLTVVLNLFLAVFNLLPLPPLDGSHIVRNFLPYKAVRVYDSMGMISLLLMLIIGSPVVNFFVAPALAMVNAILLSV
ncbi:site-2 protease family protein [Silvibacterium dinghuense]|uniref:Site-2 protease family protein n=1 Tax=Silvibacterium dinghuense TaxID=1560006 RepID=A0A4V1NUT7_9BACT|nr:site-2 protease family protein [Silvibacterium dinghuense]RXS93378.1 site-2 protease family protein [Silvibacterium dinghuense]GGH05329.1 peptidase M50 [Silvibacterium dinghuense]